MRGMPSTGSRPPGSRSKVQLRWSCVGPQMPIDRASSSPSRRRTMMARLAHGQARATTRRERPATPGEAAGGGRVGPGAATRDDEAVAARLDGEAVAPVGRDAGGDVVGVALEAL